MAVCKSMYLSCWRLYLSISVLLISCTSTAEFVPQLLAAFIQPWRFHTLRKECTVNALARATCARETVRFQRLNDCAETAFHNWRYRPCFTTPEIGSLSRSGYYEQSDHFHSWRSSLISIREGLAIPAVPLPKYTSRLDGRKSASTFCSTIMD